jgi:hypothetical protein
VPIVGLSRVFGRNRVLLPESFAWIRLFQVCTFGVLRVGFRLRNLRFGISSLLLVIL